MAKLTNQRWEKYAQGIIKGLSQTDAYVKAGYKARGDNAARAATRLSRNVQVQARIAELNKPLERSTIADAAEVQEYFTALLRGELTEQRVYGKDPEVFTLPPLLGDRSRAAENLARMQGLFATGNTGDEGQLDAIRDALAGIKFDEPE